MNDFNYILKLKSFLVSSFGMTEEDWRQQEKFLQIKCFKKNELLLREGKVCTEAWFIADGCCRSFIIKEGKDITTNFFQHNNYACDYLSFLTNEASNECIQALEETICVTISNKEMEYLYKTFPSYNKYGRLIGENLFISAYKNRIQFLSKSPKARYDTIIREKPWIFQRVPQHHIASFLGITPEYLSRIKKDSMS